MAKVIVVYEPKYGNTKLVAEKIVEGMGDPVSEEEPYKAVGLGKRIATQVSLIQEHLNLQAGFKCAVEGKLFIDGR